MINEKQKVIICDIDGCLLDSTGLEKHIPLNKFSRDAWGEFANHYSECKPNWAFIDILNTLHFDYSKIIFITSREEFGNVRTITENQIKECMIYDNWELYMRDYEDYRPSDLVKLDIVHDKILPKYNVGLFIDDEKDNVEIMKELNIDTMLYTMSKES